MKHIALILSAGLLVSCGSKKTKVVKDEEVTPPANISGSFMDLTCDAISGNVACIVRHKGKTLPLGDKRLLGENPPGFVAYMVEDIDALAIDESKSLKWDTYLDDKSPWGLQLSLNSSSITTKAIEFVQANKQNKKMGLALTFDAKHYFPEGDLSKRKFAILDSCLLGHYLNEWIRQPDKFRDDTVREVPLGMSETILAAAVLDDIYTSECKAKVESTHMDAFNKGVADVVTDYFKHKKIDQKLLDEVIKENPNAKQYLPSNP